MTLASLLSALEFAADRHRNQRRKDAEASPYVNHPIAVARVLAVEGRVTRESLLMAAVLHDTVEDTQTTFRELKAKFGPVVAGLVREVTDKKSLKTRRARKDEQIARARHWSRGAKQLKIADKMCNIRDIIARPPTKWSLKRKLGYVASAEKVVAGCRGVNHALDAVFDAVVVRARGVLGRTS